MKMANKSMFSFAAVFSMFVFVVSGLIFTVVSAAELTEAEKKAIEAQLKAAELAKEAAKNGTTTTTPAPKPASQVIKATINGRVSAVNSTAITVGIIGENIFTVTTNTVVNYNGGLAIISNVYVGDKVVVSYNASTKEAITIEAEGYRFPATYSGTNVNVLYVGMIARTDFGMVTSNGAGVKLDAGVAQVALNGAPATINDIRLGDTIDYIQSSVDLKAYFVKIKR